MGRRPRVQKENLEKPKICKNILSFFYIHCYLIVKNGVFVTKILIFRHMPENVYPWKREDSP